MSNRRQCTVSEGHFIRGMKLHLPRAGKQISPHKGGWSTSQKARHQSQQWISGPQRLTIEAIWGRSDTPFQGLGRNVSNISLMSPSRCAEAALEKILVPLPFSAWSMAVTENPQPSVLAGQRLSEFWLCFAGHFPPHWWVSSLKLCSCTAASLYISPSSRPSLSCYLKAQCCAALGRAALSRAELLPSFLTPVPVPALTGALLWTLASLARAMTAQSDLSHHPVPLSNWPASCFNPGSSPPWSSTTPSFWPWPSTE